VYFPYEYFPVPEAGDCVQGRNNEGNVVCGGTVEKVSDLPAYRADQGDLYFGAAGARREVRGIGIFQKGGWAMQRLTFL
jgi:hypothetical protein